MKQAQERSRAPLKIGQVEVGSDAPVFVVAEVGMAHDGSLGAAHAYIDGVAGSGAQAIKFQTHIADAESTPGEPFRKKFSYQDASRYDYWKRLEFTPEQWAGLKRHAEEVGLIFLSTPFSFEALDLLVNIGVPALKVGSGETTNLPMLTAMGRTGLPVLLSTGMASWAEVDEAVATLESHHDQIGIFQCTTAYPCAAEQVGLNVVRSLQDRYPYPAGLSDHSGLPYASIGACALGADMIEVHVVFSKACFGPDTGASVVLGDLPGLVEGCQFVRRAIANPIDKDAVALEMQDLKTLFGKSAYAARDMVAGETLKMEDMILRKPAAGILAKEMERASGRTLTRDVARGAVINWTDIGGEHG